MPGFPLKKPSGLKWNPTCSTFMHGKSSGRGTCATPKQCHSTTSVPVSPPRDRSSFVHAGSPWNGAPCGVNSPAGNRSSSACGVTHRCFVANAPLVLTAHSGPVSRTGCAGPLVKGTSLYPTDSPVIGFIEVGFETRHVRAVDWSHTRMACCSETSRVLTGPKALWYGSDSPTAFPTHPVTKSTSSTVFAKPSTSTSKRAQNMCWCTCALTLGATITPCFGLPSTRSPADSKFVLNIPDSFISYSKLPSWLKYQ
mmetsp:Transcript_10823/g.35751  ORF Transcript_10823/g.35751 Transcript_10823/m.35751 type:complete len:254 (+) Transcript_10823:177-938(+)